MASLAVVILTLNEARHIGRALDSVATIASQVFVIDAGSTDDTAAIAKARGAIVLTNPWTNHAAQVRWALEHAPITADWVMRLDADEIIGPDLAEAIAKRLDALPADVCGVNFKRRYVFMGRWIKHGGLYPAVFLRLWRRGQAMVEDRWMDEHMALLQGRAVTFDGEFADINLNNLSYWVDKHNKYATSEAVEVLAKRYALFERKTNAGLDASPQAARKRLIKEKLYNHLPLGVGPLGYFAYRYLFQLGFLDGPEGLIFHGLQGFWYRFLVDAKRAEFDRALRQVERRDEKLKLLAQLTGLKLLAE